MKTLSGTLVLSIALASVTLNLHANRAWGAEGKAKTEAYSSTSAYISVDVTASEQAMLNAIVKTYAHMAATNGVLRRSINEDTTAEGRKLDRIKQTSYFADNLQGTIKNLKRDLRITAVPGTNLIRVSIESAKPTERAEIANALADAIVFAATQQHKRLISSRLGNLTTRLDEQKEEIVAKQKMIEQIRGQSEVPLMKFEHTIVSSSLATVRSELMSLGIQKARAETKMETLKKKQSDGSLAKSPEIQSVVAKDPGVTELRSALLQAKIAALGDRGNKQLIAIQKALETMLTARQQAAAGEVVKLRNSKLANDVSTIREQLMAVRNQYNEQSATLRDLGKKLSYIARLESDIDRLKQRAGELEAAMLRLRINMGIPPLTLYSPAELH
jgi:hypothetical protein